MSNASGNQSGDSATTPDAVDSGQSEDIEASLTGQGTSDRETVEDIEDAQGAPPAIGHTEEAGDESPSEEELRAQREAAGDSLPE